MTAYTGSHISSNIKSIEIQFLNLSFWFVSKGQIYTNRCHLQHLQNIHLHMNKVVWDYMLSEEDDFTIYIPLWPACPGLKMQHKWGRDMEMTSLFGSC